MNDRGSLLPLVAGLLALAGVFVVGVIDSTDLTITRTQLQSVADGAALAAAQSVTPGTTSLSGNRLVITLTPAGVTRVARKFVTDAAVPGVGLRTATTPDGRTAVVTTATTWRPPLLSEFLPVRLGLIAVARARTVFD
ncbi:MAG: pilus assembly protein TadG-related protein [Microbacteriaceae bacterium]